MYQEKQILVMYSEYHCHPRVLVLWGPPQDGLAYRGIENRTHILMKHQSQTHLSY